MVNIMKWLVVLLGLYASVSAADAVRVGLDEVKVLGQLNGKALACSQKDNISRIKDIMIGHAPKSRLYGVAFEESTQEAFLERSREQHSCGDAPVIALQVETQAARLRELFPAAGKK